MLNWIMPLEVAMPDQPFTDDTAHRFSAHWQVALVAPKIVQSDTNLSGKSHRYLVGVRMRSTDFRISDFLNF